MFWNAKNGNIPLEHGDMDYIVFGKGERHLILLPGLGDGLKTVRGTALPFAWMYRIFAKDFRVWVFSRRNDLSQGCTTRDMARDQAEAMEKLGIARADIIGISMGGMVAQHLAADFPGLINRLVLVVTAAEPNPMITEAIRIWSDMARRQDYGALMADTGARMYSEKYLRKNSWMFPLTGKLTAPRSNRRFLLMANACAEHNAMARLTAIQSPALVIGGKKDKTLGGDPSRQIAAQIPGSTLRMYPELGHSLYEEAPDFNAYVKNWLLT